MLDINIANYERFKEIGILNFVSKFMTVSENSFIGRGKKTSVIHFIDSNIIYYLF